MIDEISVYVSGFYYYIFIWANPIKFILKYIYSIATLNIIYLN